MPFLPSERMDRVQAPIIPLIARWITESPGTISLGQGVVHYGPPPEARTAMDSVWESPGHHLYQSVQGLATLREEIAKKLQIDNGIEVSDERSLFVTAGGNMAFMTALFAIANAGDEIILPSPFYFNHDMAVDMVGARTVAVATTDTYDLDVDRLEAAITPRTRAIVTVSPNNPTGAVYAEDRLRDVNALCAKRGLFHVSDEAYEYFTFGDAHHVSPGRFPGAGDHTLSLYSLSKSYGMAGWRVGYLHAPPALHVAIAKALDTQLICAPTASQLAAVGAMRAGRTYCRPFIQRLEQLQQDVFDALLPLGDRIRVTPARGAFYLLLKLHTEESSLFFVEQLIKRHRVAVLPGSAFGISEGCYLRVAFGALHARTVKEGIGRLVEGLDALL